MFTSGEVTIYTHFYCIQGYHTLFVPLIRCQRGLLDNCSPPMGLGSFVKLWFMDRGAAWSLLRFGVLYIARRRASAVACSELGIWS